MDLMDTLFDAVVRGNESVVEHILQMGGSLLMNDDQGLTALHWAAASTEGEKMVPFLIAQGADIHVRDNLGRTPLHAHCSKGRIYAVACLVHHGADPNVTTTASADQLFNEITDSYSVGEGVTPLDIAIAHDQAEIVRVLLAYGAVGHVSGGRNLIIGRGNSTEVPDQRTQSNGTGTNT